MILTEYDIQYTTQKAIKGSVLADHLAHQAVEDYQPMKFEFPDEDIMMVNNYEESRPYDRPEQGSRWTLIFYGASNALDNGIGDESYFLKDVILLLQQDSASIVQITWRNMKRAFFVSKLP